MSDPNQQIVELVRKVDSEFHDPNLHGQGVVVSWNRKKKQWVSNQGALSKVLGRKNVDYYFVKTNSKPIYIKKLSFEWCEGTSDVSLAFEANFQIRIRDEQDAEKLVQLLIQTPAISVDNAFYQLIDERLHASMEGLYIQCNSARKNLLDEFYLTGSPKGENFDLDNEVSQAVNSSLQGLDFRIGFTLFDAPERVADFSHCTQLKKSPSQKEFDVESECMLKLNNYQMYKRSGIKNLDESIAYMKKVIDQAINEYVSGKSLFDLFSNFGSSSESNKKSILEQVRQQVEDEAQAIGYELQSFYSLPDVAPLKLLNGIRIDIDENEAFSTAYGGGNIKINAGLDVKAIHGSFDDLLHLLSPSGNSQDMDVLEFNHNDLVKRIKDPIVAICANVIKQKDYKTASIDFNEKVKSDIESTLENEMKTRYGLKVEVKSMFPVETEDSSRLRELSGKSKQFDFSITSHGVDNSEFLVDCSCAFKVTGIDMDAGWDAFEKTDFGYRTNSPERKLFKGLDENATDYDRLCKNKAIEEELNDIADELFRYFRPIMQSKSNLYARFRSPAENQKLQDELLSGAVLAIAQKRGLIVDIENIALDDKFITEKAAEERERKYAHIEATQLKKNDLVLEQLEKSVKRKSDFDDYIAEERKSLISDIDSIEELQRIEEQAKDPLENVTEAPESISQSLNSSLKLSQDSPIDESVKELEADKKKKAITNQGEEE